jgi:drug/metabolite transporter (DMT)-like permease
MNVRQFGQLALLGALWGASFRFMWIAAPVLGPLYLIEFRVLLAGLVLLPIVWLRGQQRDLLAHRRQLLITGLLGAALPVSLLAFATLERTAGLNSVLNATVPIFAALSGAVRLGDAFSRPGLAGVVLGYVGVIVLVGMPGLGADVPSWVSVAAGLCAAISEVLAPYDAKQSISG